MKKIKYLILILFLLILPLSNVKGIELKKEISNTKEEIKYHPKSINIQNTVESISYKVEENKGSLEELANSITDKKITFSDKKLKRVEENCNSLFTKEGLDIIKKIVKYIQIIIPILLILLITIDMVKAMLANDDKKMKEAYSNGFKRIIAGIIIFLIPMITSILLGLEGVRGVLEGIGIIEDPLCLKSEGTSSLKVTANINPSVYTKGEVEITLTTVTGDYKKVKIGEYELETSLNSQNKRVAKYKVRENGTYEFEFYDKEGELILIKKVVINNIGGSLPSGKCTYTENVIRVSGSSGTGALTYGYKVNDNGYSDSTNVTYNSYETIETASVRIKDSFGDTVELECEKRIIEKKDSKLEVFFAGYSTGTIIIRSDTKILLLGIGSDRAEKFATSTINFMKKLGITQIDAFFAKSPTDGYIGGLERLHTNFTVMEHYYPFPLPFENKSLKSSLDALSKNGTQLKMGDIIEFDGEFSIEVVGPYSLSFDCAFGTRCGIKDTLSFILRHNDITFFFSGNYIWSKELLATNPANTFKSNVLFYPNNGFNDVLHNTISMEMFKAISPEYVMFLSYWDYRQEIMQNYSASLGAKSIFTGECVSSPSCYGARKNGDVVFTSDGKTLKYQERIKVADFAR